MTIDALPPAPNRATDTPQQFSDKADAFASALITFQQQANADVAGIINTASVPLWAATTSYSRGNSVYSPATYFTYRLITASLAGNAANQDPSVDTTNWKQVTGTGNVSQGGPASLTSITYSGEVATTSTSALQVPVGNTAARPTAATGKIRFNTSLSQFEGYNGTAWASIGGGATGAGADQVFVLNDRTVTQSYTIPAGKGASTVGPLTINSGVMFTVATGARLVIL